MSGEKSGKKRAGPTASAHDAFPPHPKISTGADTVAASIRTVVHVLSRGENYAAVGHVTCDSEVTELAASSDGDVVVFTVLGDKFLRFFQRKSGTSEWTSGIVSEPYRRRAVSLDVTFHNGKPSAVLASADSDVFVTGLEKAAAAAVAGIVWVPAPGSGAQSGAPPQKKKQKKQDKEGDADADGTGAGEGKTTGKPGFDAPQPDLHEDEFALGHTSILLSARVYPRGAGGDGAARKFFVTCDQDNKGRVSCYPEGYAIVSFLLGHASAVYASADPFNDASVIVTCSADGTLRSFDARSGRRAGIIDATVGSEKDFGERALHAKGAEHDASYSGPALLTAAEIAAAEACREEASSRVHVERTVAICDVRVVAEGPAPAADADEAVVYFAVAGVPALFAAAVRRGTGELRYAGRVDCDATPLAIACDVSGGVWVSTEKSPISLYRPTEGGKIAWPLARVDAGSDVEAINSSEVHPRPSENLRARELCFPHPHTE